MIDKEYDIKCTVKRWGKNKTGDTCCLTCRKCATRRPKADRHKNHRRKR
jgi:hypothetical protein